MVGFRDLLRSYGRLSALIRVAVRPLADRRILDLLDHREALLLAVATYKCSHGPGTDRIGTRMIGIRLEPSHGFVRAAECRPRGEAD